MHLSYYLVVNTFIQSRLRVRLGSFKRNKKATIRKRRIQKKIPTPKTDAGKKKTN